MIQMAPHEDKIAELEERVEKLEEKFFGRKRPIRGIPVDVEASPLQLEDLKIPNDVLSILQARIRKIGYWSLVLILLYFAPQSLTYSHIMTATKQLKKPVSYEWLNTEFHRKKYSGLVRSEPIPGMKERAYTLNEPGRRRAETVLTRLKSENQ